MLCTALHVSGILACCACCNPGHQVRKFGPPAHPLWPLSFPYSQQPATEVWLVSEFCNRGPLLTAIERGAFLTQPSSQYGQPNLISVLQVGWGPCVISCHGANGRRMTTGHCFAPYGLEPGLFHAAPWYLTLTR